MAMLNNQMVKENRRVHIIWVNYNDLTVLPNPGIMVNKGNHPQMALIQISEIYPIQFIHMVFLLKTHGKRLKNIENINGNSI